MTFAKPVRQDSHHKNGPLARAVDKSECQQIPRVAYPDPKQIPRFARNDSEGLGMTGLLVLRTLQRPCRPVGMQEIHDPARSEADDHPVLGNLNTLD